MKHLSFILAFCGLLVLSSCKTPMKHMTYYLDYQVAGQGKVFITESNSVSFEYDPLGSIIVCETPGYVTVTVPTTEKERSYDELYYKAPEKTVGKYSKATAQSALNYAADEAVRLGGNGIINLRVEAVSDSRGNTTMIIISGMVIKRKQAIGENFNW